jgi:hypothetical protein
LEQNEVYVSRWDWEVRAGQWFWDTACSWFVENVLI